MPLALLVKVVLLPTLSYIVNRRLETLSAIRAVVPALPSVRYQLEPERECVTVLLAVALPLESKAVGRLTTRLLELQDLTALTIRMSRAKRSMAVRPVVWIWV